MKSKDQTLLEEAYTKVLKEGSREMTPEQERTYFKFEKLGYEFDRWEDNNVIMLLMDRGYDSAVKLEEIAIKPNGKHYEL